MADVSLRDRRQALLERPDLRGMAFCRAYARRADEWLSAQADRATDGDPGRLALLAVGGYGRGELCPFSDLDVVLVHDGRRDVAAVADAIWYPVWDEGVRLDHSVRRPKEVLAVAGDDLRVALGLLDARLVWGDTRVAEPLLARALALWRSRLGAQWLPTIEAQMAERRRASGDVAFLLEPDVKESHGGLRDIRVVTALARFAPALADYVDLAPLDRAADVLTDIRVELHRSAGREQDRLLLQDQDHVAEVLGFDDADVLMAAVAEAGRGVAWTTSDAWRRRRFWAPEPGAGRRRLFGRHPSPPAHDEPVASPEELEPGIAVVGGDVALTPGAAVADDSSLALRLAAVAAEHQLPIARGSLYRLADKMPPPPDPWPVETREALVRVLAAGPPAIDALEALDQEDLLSRLIPEWRAVRNKPQRNAYHRFTVDRHLLEAAANAAALVDRVSRPDLLLVGALLHDIGKGFPGDHTQVGIEVVGTMATRMGFPPADVETLVDMVRYHLLLPDTATRRDLDDPETVATVTRAARDRQTLELLAALTEADSLATGPSAWGTWKAGLVAELAHRAAEQLDGRPVTAAGGWITDAHRQMIGEVRQAGRPVVGLEPPQVVVAAPDRRGLLASVAGTLALHGLDVRSADVTSGDGVAVEVFTVEVGPRSWPDSVRLREDLDAVLTDPELLGAKLDEKARAYAGIRRAASARPVVPQVTVDNGASASSTVVEVRAEDDLGLLHRVTEALFDCDLDVVSARVSTIGGEVVDAFYVRNGGGSKVTEPDMVERIEHRVRAAIS
ncbi:MAG TPA: [protein-PII] uridylyltransferase [Acidimicrobiales bacterium]|nr:[protein-PII] uridylyltransferase [Acidimicrobiales bacterium]